MIDQLNFVGNFDTGWYDPFHHELGVTLSDLVISQPFFIPAEEPDDEEEPDITENDTGTAPEYPDTGSNHQDTGDSFTFSDDTTGTGTEDEKGCMTVNRGGAWVAFMAALMLFGLRRREQ